MTARVLFRLEGVGMLLGGQEVLREITFEVHQGEIFALMGPSGVGKSTLLRLMNLFEKPTTGRLLFREKEIENGREEAAFRLRIRREMSLVFQQPYLFDASVFQNVAFGLEVREMGWETIRERVRSYVEVGGSGGRFLFHLGNVGADTPPDHVRAAVGEVRSWEGRFDG